MTPDEIDIEHFRKFGVSETVPMPKDEPMCMNCYFDENKFCVRRHFAILNEDAPGCTKYIRRYE